MNSIILLLFTYFSSARLHVPCVVVGEALHSLTVRAEKAQTNMTISDSRKESQTEIESN